MVEFRENSRPRTAWISSGAPASNNTGSFHDIVPKVLRRIVLLQRIFSEVGVERAVFERDDSVSLFLSFNIHQQGTFMMNVILLATVVQTPIQIVQPVRLLKRWFGMRRALTKRDREIVNNEDSFTDHFEEYAKGTIFTVLGLSIRLWPQFCSSCILLSSPSVTSFINIRWFTQRLLHGEGLGRFIKSFASNSSRTDCETYDDGGFMGLKGHEGFGRLGIQLCGNHLVCYYCLQTAFVADHQPRSIG